MKAINDFLYEHWVLIYGLSMYCLGRFIGYINGRR